MLLPFTANYHQDLSSTVKSALADDDPVLPTERGLQFSLASSSPFHIIARLVVLLGTNTFSHKTNEVLRAVLLPWGGAAEHCHRYLVTSCCMYGRVRLLVVRVFQISDGFSFLF